MAKSWEALEALESSAVDNGGSAAAVDEVRKRKEDAESEHRRLYNDGAELENELESKEHNVPLDALGRRRIPMKWYEKAAADVKGSALRAVEAEQARGQVGLRDEGGAWNWVPCVLFPASEETMGILWLAFDADERVVDVSTNLCHVRRETD